MLSGTYHVTNTEATAAPPGCALEPTGEVDPDGRLKVRRATADDQLGVLVNGLVLIPAGGSGTAFAPFPGVVFGVHPSDALAARDVVGSKNGDWHLRKGQKGFRYVGGDATGHRFGNAVPEPAAAGTDYFYAQLTSGTSPFSWVERVQSSAGVWANGSRSGATNAYQVRPSSGAPTAPAANDVVLMRLSPAVSGVYEFVLADKAASGGTTPAKTDAVLSSAEDLNAASDRTWTDISGLTLSLAPGSYLVLAKLRFSGVVTSSAQAAIYCRLDLGGTVVTDSQAVGCFIDAIDEQNDNTVTVPAWVTVAGPGSSTLKVQFYKDAGGGTWLASRLMSDTTQGRSTLMAVNFG